MNKYYISSTLAAAQRRKREFNATRMVKRQEYLLFLGRVHKAADQFALLGCSKSVAEAIQHLFKKLSFFFHDPK